MDPMCGYSHMESLPAEIVERILCYLSVVEELYIAARVCKLWYGLCNEIVVKKTECFKQGLAQGRVSWRGLTQSGDIPSPRYMHRAVIVNKWMYVFAGSPRQNFLLNSFYKLNIETLQWKRLLAADKPPPTPRIHFTMSVYKHYIIIIGGMFTAGQRSMAQSKVCNDILTYDTIHDVWSLPKTIPCAIRSHSATVLGDRVIVFGGTPGNVMSMRFNLFGLDVSTVLSDCSNMDVQELRSEVEVGPRMMHLEAKLSDTQVLIMGGVTRIPDSTKAEALSDCWLMNVYNTHVQWTQINIDSGPELVYIRPYIDCFSGVAVGDTVLFVSRPKFCTDKVLGDGTRLQQIHERPTFAHQFARVDYFHTFVLDITHVRNGEASWRTVEPNPARRAPKTSVCHSLLVAGDSMLLFGGNRIGGMGTQLSQQTSTELNTLYKICVPQTVGEGY